MNIIQTETHHVLTEYGSYKLKYELQEYVAGGEREGNDHICYGIRICQVREENGELFDICQVRGIATIRATANSLFRSIADGLVMPVSLLDVIEDWQSAASMV